MHSRQQYGFQYTGKGKHYIDIIKRLRGEGERGWGWGQEGKGERGGRAEIFLTGVVPKIPSFNNNKRGNKRWCRRWIWGDPGDKRWASTSFHFLSFLNVVIFDCSLPLLDVAV